MPNALIQPSSGGVIATCPLFDAPVERRLREHFGREPMPELQKALGFWQPGGRWPAQGWVLVQLADYQKLNPYATNLQLQMEDVQTGSAITLQNLSIVQARCVSAGIPSDGSAIYLVQLTDPQGIVYNPWFQQPTQSQYNVVAPAYDGQYYYDSMNSGTGPWTWSDMIGDLWGQMTQLGLYPGLPGSPPTGTPQNFIFPGVSVWEALNRTLDYLGMSVSEDLTNANPFGIVVSGAADAAYTALAASSNGLLEDTYAWRDTGAGRVPGSVIVYFHRRNQYYGTEETVRPDGLQWSSQPYYQVQVGAPPMFSSAVGVGYLWADFSVRFDIDGNPLAFDVTTANAIAAERVAQFYNLIYRGTQGYLRNVYTGLIPFAAGSLLDGVCWRQNRDGGWRTETWRGYTPPELTFPLAVQGLTGWE